MSNAEGTSCQTWQQKLESEYTMWDTSSNYPHPPGTLAELQENLTVLAETYSMEVPLYLAGLALRQTAIIGERAFGRNNQLSQGIWTLEEKVRNQFDRVCADIHCETVYINTKRTSSPKKNKER